jgi:SulP family sulfate permease
VVKTEGTPMVYLAANSKPLAVGEPVFYGLHFKNLRGDIYGGITTAVIALPLSLAFGIASGLGPIAGLYSAILLGFFAALFGGQPVQISGPTGPLTVVMATIVLKFGGDPAMCFGTVVLAGLFLILGGFLKLGKYINLVPYPVVSGFMTGVGIIIISLQWAPLTGHTGNADIINIYKILPSWFDDINPQAFILGLICLGIVGFYPKKLDAIIPSPLVALVMGSLLGNLVFLDAAQIGTIPHGIPMPSWPDFSFLRLNEMIVPALMLAVLNAIDSLMTATLADNMTRVYHKPNKELIGQGIGNIMAALFGGIAGCGAAMRTSVNVRSGGRTPISGALHAIILLLLVLGFGAFAERIPYAVLAGILIKVGYDIIDWQYIRRFPRAPRKGVFLMILVVALTVFTDLITAVAVGVVIASILNTKAIADTQLENLKLINDESTHPLSLEEREILRRYKSQITLFHLMGPMSFGAANEMSRIMGVIDGYEVMLLDLSDVTHIDSSSGLAIEDTIENAQGRGQKVFIIGLRPKVKEVLERLGILSHLPADAIFTTRYEALKNAVNLLAPKAA